MISAHDRYEMKDLTAWGDIDVLVAGGGTSGVAAAISAARRGANVVIVERGIVLGGSQTQGLVVPMMPTNSAGSDTPFVSEVKEYLRRHGAEPSDGVTGTSWTNPDVLVGRPCAVQCHAFRRNR